MTSYQKEWYQKNKLRLQEKSKLKRLINPEYFDEYNKKRSERRRQSKLEKGLRTELDYRSRHPSYKLWLAAYNRAYKFDIPFDIDVQDIVIPECCPVFKTPFEKGTRYAASLDKIKPELGYIKGNIQVISLKANMMKQDATQEELEMFSEWLKITLKSRP